MSMSRLLIFAALFAGAILAVCYKANAAIDPGFVPCEAQETCPQMWREGDAGTHVVRLQIRLSEYGYDLAVTGHYGPETARAVRAFQRNKGLGGDAIVGPRAREALAEPIRLRGGAKGEPVANLQERLNRLGYGVLEVDGIMGPHTQYALAEFQARNGLERDAVLGPETRAALDHDGAVHAPRDFVLKDWNRGFAVPLRLVNALVRQESGGRTTAVSRAGALGKFQIMPGTARKWGRSCGYSWLHWKTPYRDVRRALFNPQISEDLARCYINHYWAKYRRYELVLVAYNGGPGRAEQAARCFRRNGTICTFRRETYHYVKNIMAMAGIPRAPVTYGRRG